MKLRDLRQSSGGIPVWPPRWVESPDAAGHSDVPENGVLEGLERFGDRLLLRINVDGHRRTATLQWNPPPAVSDIEAVLLGSIGAAIRDLGEREVPTRSYR